MTNYVFKQPLAAIVRNILMGKFYYKKDFKKVKQ